ncbi:MAG: tetratricopeptide repeat protein, partial [Candidatus Moranbacteria bacterium]|nr:tetratricopeptide repeat protein [Candidatus Moranbacteria bacterium]
VNFLLGESAQKIGFWTKAAWSDVSDLTGAKGGFKDQVHEIALNYFKEAIKLNPQFAKAYSQVAESLYSLKRYSESIPYYDKVIELEPDNAGAYNDRGLAKTYINDYYSATSDFSDAIRLKKKDQNSLENTYENRANAYIKASNYDRAIEDYSSAIGLKFASTVFIMSLPQIRTLYPELSDISDKDLLEGLRQKYFPNMSSVDFVGNYKDNSKKIGCDFVFATLYSNRADVYISKGDFKGATREYTRATHCDEKYTSTLDRWKTISKTSDTEYLVDSQTIDFSQGNVVFLWAEILNTNDKSYSKSNFQINCSEKKIKSLSATNYNSVGNITGNIPAQDWQSVIPETIGEVLYNGMCVNK